MMQTHYIARVRAKFNRLPILQTVSTIALFHHQSAAANTTTQEPEILLALAIGALVTGLFAFQLLIKFIDSRPDVTALAAFASIGAGLIALVQPLPGINPAVALLTGFLLLFVAAFSHNRRAST